MNSLRVLALGLLLQASACGGDGGVPLDQFDDGIARSACTKIFACCDVGARNALLFDFNPSTLTTEAECEDRVRAFVRMDISLEQPAIEAGKIAYHGDVASDCLAALDSASCSELRYDLFSAGSCGQVLVGTVARGEACDTGPECAGDDSFCMGSSPPLVPGICAVRPAEGKPCPDGECARGSYCKGEFPGGTCAPLEADGGPCQWHDDCQSGSCDYDAGECAAVMCSGP